MKLLDEIAKEIRPTKEEAENIKKRVIGFIKKIRIKGAKAILGGSGAKGTWIRGQFDADIFVLFDYEKFYDKDISKILEKELKKHFKFSKVHGSRDYFQVRQKEFLFEVIPILGIKKASEAQNITDVSPLHSLFVKKNINNKLADEIGILKQFCRANNIYGAESYIQGFSGYVCELLIIYYKSFINLLKNSVKWESQVVIDIKKYYKNKNEIFNKINKSKLQSPLIIIDPVQKDRNAAAALSFEKFELFRQKAKEFLKNPSKKFFVKKEITIDELKKKAKNKKLIILDVKALAGKEDVVGSKLLKCLNYINKKLAENGFNVIDFGWRWDKAEKATFWFILDKKDLELYIKQIGPPVKDVNNVKRFKKKHKNTFIENNRVCTKVKRDFTKAQDLIKNLIKKDSNIKNKIKEIKVIF